jgi:hypothetical protein
MVEHRRQSDVAIADETEIEPVETKRVVDEEHPIKEVRATDIEPYTGLRYLSKLFRFMAIIVILLIIAEVVTGLSAQGAAAVPTLLGEASRLIVLAGVLWGTGDLALLLIDVGHDVRASRIMLARQEYHARKNNGREYASGTGGIATRPLVADRSPGTPPPIP